MSQVNQNTRKLVLAALFVALEIVVTRAFAIQVNAAIRLSFQSAVFALGGFFLGPAFAAAAFVASDLLGVAINSGGFSINPGLTLCAALSGIIYGYILHKKPIGIMRTILAFAIHTVAVNLLLRTFALALMTGQPFLAMLAQRMVTVPFNALMSCIVACVLLKVLPAKVQGLTGQLVPNEGDLPPNGDELAQQMLSNDDIIPS